MLFELIRKWTVRGIFVGGRIETGSRRSLTPYPALLALASVSGFVRGLTEQQTLKAVERNNSRVQPSVRSAATVLVISLLGISVLVFAVPIARAQTTTQTSNCTSANTMRMTLEPIPNSFNILTSGVFSAFEIPFIEQLSIAPYPTLPNGSLDWSEAVTNSVTHNANYTVWTFNVKPGLTWSNGTPVNASDILNTFSKNYALSPAYDYLPLSPEIKSEYALNSSAAVFVLNKSDAHLGEEMASYLFTTIEPSSDIALGPSANLFGSDVSAGPFYLSSYTSGSTEAILSRNPYYKPLPAICQIDVNFVESESAIVPFLASGQTDYATPISGGNVGALSAYPNIHISETQGTFIQTLAYNVSAYPYNQTAFRQALAYAINYSAIINQGSFGYALSGANAEGDVPSNVAQYNPNIVKYTTDTNRSLALLQSIGITKGTDGFLHYANGTAVSLTLWAENTNPADAVAGGIVQQDLTALGMKIQLNIIPQSDLGPYLHKNVQGIDHDAFITTAGGAIFTNPWLDAQPGYNVYLYTCISVGCTWEGSSSAEAQYQGNLTAIDATGSPSLEQSYLNNIENISAQNLPTLVLDYPDTLSAYNTQHFTGWPSSPGYTVYQKHINLTMLATLQPVSASQTTTVSSSGTPMSSYYYVILGAAVVVLAVAVGAAYALRRGRKGSPAPKS